MSKSVKSRIILLSVGVVLGLSTSFGANLLLNGHSISEAGGARIENIDPLKHQKLLQVVKSLHQNVMQLERKLDQLKTAQEVQTQDLFSLFDNYASKDYEEHEVASPTLASSVLSRTMITEQDQLRYEALVSRITDPLYIQTLTSDNLYQSEEMKSLPKSLKMKITDQVTDMLNRGEIEPDQFFSRYDLR